MEQARTQPKDRCPPAADAETQAAGLARDFSTGTHHFHAGRFAEAEAYYRRVLSAEPRHAGALHRLGLIAWHDGRVADAAQLIGDAAAQRPDDAEAASNLGVVLLSLDRAAEAAEACRRSVTLRPGHAGSWSNLGNVLRALGDPPAARDAYRRALALQPDLAGALAGLADLLASLGHLEEAVALGRRAVLVAPNLAAAHFALGRALRRQGALEAAAAAYAAGLAHDPGNAPSWLDAGRLHRSLGRLEAAAAAFRQAIACAPRCADAFSELGSVLLALQRADAAVAACRAAIAIEPDFAEAHANLGAALAQQRDFTEAIAHYRRALALRPDLVEAGIEICDLRRTICDWEGLEASCAEALARGLEANRPVAPFPLLNLVDDPALHLRYARAWAKGLGHGHTPAAKVDGPARPSQDRRLRIGYLSSDFHRHATASLMAGVFEHHDRRDFEIFGYSCGPDDGSPMRRRLSQGIDRFVDLRAESHGQAAALIGADRLDILIDLKGYTKDSRPEILARRPAPLQVAFLGFPGTLGAPFSDYILVDPVVVPPDQAIHYHEHLIHLPHCYQPNDRGRRIGTPPPSRRDCGLPDQAFVFCCFNAAHKITPAIFTLWMGILAEVPQAVLWLLDPHPTACANLRRAAERHRIAPERLVFGARLPLDDHLARLGLADLFLDTLPYNAHTTGSEALWAGLPLLTCTGQAFAGRVGASLLAAVGLPELIAASPHDYAAAALYLARMPEVLALLRRRLAANRDTAPLFDTARSTRDLERAYRRIAARAAAGLPPQPFTLEAED